MDGMRQLFDGGGLVPVAKGDARMVMQLAEVNERLRAENAEVQGTLDRIWAADQRAIKAWQIANPGNELVWPDRAQLVGWLLDRAAAAEGAQP